MGPQSRSEVWTRERCFINELLNSPSHPEVSVARARVEPGITTELHRLSVAEWYVIERGNGRMQVGPASPFPVGPGAIVAIAPQVAQRVANTAAEDLVFLCICAPRFTIDCYTALTHQEEYNDVWPKSNN